MIDHKKKLLFIHIARTGGSSIEKALVKQDWWTIDPDTKHLSARQAREHYGEDIWRSYTKFTVVRNPWDRIASMWSAKWWHHSSALPHDCSLEEFIVNLKPHPHEKYNSLFYHEILNEDLDYILRFETLKGDFRTLMKGRTFFPISLPHIQKKAQRHFTEIYSDKEKALIAEIYKEDIARYGYSQP